MKLLLIVISFFYCLGPLKAQQTKFNVIHDYDLSVGRTVFNTDSAYFMVGVNAGQNNFPYLSIWKFDTLGNVLWEKLYGDTLYRSLDANENACKRVKNGYAIAGTCLPTMYEPKKWIKLYRFDHNFDTLWTKDYLHDTVNVFARDVVICSDGGYAICGFSKRDEATGEALPQYTGKGLLLRTDSLGNYLWHKTFGGWDYGNEFHKVVQTPDGGFLCGGATRTYSSSHNWDWYLVKTDSLGQEEWHKTYGNSAQDDYRISGITITLDTNYIITGGRAANSETYRPYIKVLDKNFNSIITKTLPYQSSEAYIGRVIEIPNVGYIAIGGDRINNEERVIVNLTKFDYDFNTIWRRQYTSYDTTNVDNYMLSVDTCVDGGYVIGGFAWVYDGIGQSLSLIKTDSLGCDGTDWWDCSTGVMIKKYANSESFKMYPNPATSFAIVEGSYFDRLSNHKVESVAIYDVTGKLVKHISSNEHSNNLKIDVSDLRSGIYMVKLGDRIKKLIVN